MDYTFPEAAFLEFNLSITNVIFQSSLTGVMDERLQQQELHHTLCLG